MTNVNAPKVQITEVKDLQNPYLKRQQKKSAF